ncbi:MAG: tetratricopeptide repeat protein [Candidatus Acidiferrales bacterium]
MNRLSTRNCMAVLFTLLVALPSWGQKSGGAGSTGTGSTGSTTPSQPGTSVPGAVGQQPGQPQFPTPVFVNGRILMDTGQPVPEAVSVALGCGMRSMQVIQTDLKGYFQFTLGAGTQSNMDFSASSDARMSRGNGGMQSSNGMGSSLGGSQGMLTGCEVRVSVPGYVPLSKTITDRADMTGVEIGTLRLTRIAGVTGSSISVTSLLVSEGARKEFEKGDKDARNNHLDSATQHLEKAVTQYDKYAAAWNKLGNIYATDKEIEKSRQAYEKAIAADPHYIPPYLGLASLELQNQENEPSVETAGKALELDSSIGVANYIQAIGNFRLNRLDDADKSAQMAEKTPHQGMPDLHALHAKILLQKRDYPNAAAQMRAYLKEFPQGRFADEMKKDLQQIEQSDADAGSKSGSAQAQIAP